MATKIYVGGIAQETTESDLEQLFSAHGDVEGAMIAVDDKTHIPMGFGYVKMISSEDALRAIMALNTKDFNGRRLAVKQAKLRDVLIARW